MTLGFRPRPYKKVKPTAGLFWCVDMAPAIKYNVFCSMDATDASFDCSPRMWGLTKMGEMCKRIPKGLFSTGNL